MAVYLFGDSSYPKGSQYGKFEWNHFGKMLRLKENSEKNYLQFHPTFSVLSEIPNVYVAVVRPIFPPYIILSGILVMGIGILACCIIASSEVFQLFEIFVEILKFSTRFI